MRGGVGGDRAGAEAEHADRGEDERELEQPLAGHFVLVHLAPDRPGQEHEQDEHQGHGEHLEGGRSGHAGTFPPRAAAVVSSGLLHLWRAGA